VFDLRYHIASLAAVFLALVVGILVGVGITSQGVISTSERKLLNERIAERTSERDAARQRAQELQRSQRVAQAFVKKTYGPLMSGRLASTRVAVLFVGSVDGGLRSEIDETLVDGDAPPVLRLRALRVPFDVPAIERILASRRTLARYAGDAQLGALGSALADEFVLGGKTPVWNALTNQLVEERAGSAAGRVDAVVVARSAPPQSRGSARLLAGFYTEMAALGLPVVGVEEQEALGKRSAIETYRRHGFSSVDDLDTTPGRLALGVLLADGQPGHYGVKPTADDLLPAVYPVQTTPPGG
jgi:hypothetical protein